MPELPEVEEAARRLAAVVVRHPIARVHLLHPATRRCLTTAQSRSLVGRRVGRVERRGKHQLLHLDDGRVLVVHFRMTGDWAVGPAGVAHHPHARAALDLADGTRVALVDPRALATLQLVPAGADPLPGLARDANDPAFDAAALGAALARKRSAVKPALLDQGVVAGLGNIYAAEALWEARISPRAPAARIGAERVARLLAAIRATLERADPGRYYGGAGEPRFRVYDRAGEPCPRCGATIARIVQAGRSTYYCPRCQRR